MDILSVFRLSFSHLRTFSILMMWERITGVKKGREHENNVSFPLMTYIISGSGAVQFSVF
jgi:hypothetical protein